ncbi:DUF3592 domain-containing protein [Aquimarina sp. MMG016]|uniref:DUF3592 domain-containing protein n=1 Tax=Aquimarina sp. MMG016 TaxID=2822690 RepID=UPI001B3A51F0|nr:DUF3592 domain-containing protein [Aquimarina sp. MMG016]MBQ4818746.1 DUF3592 domain-containing protein [Aquimarina sp. MMG016]
MNRKFIGLIAVLLACIGVLTYNTYTKKENLVKNGASTSAIIEKISTNRIDNELSPTVENIHVKYKYIVDAKEFIKTQEVSRHEHDLYFAKTGKVGDSIKIIYDAENPKNSKIEKTHKK